jgi:hypothetical protein
MRVNAANRCSDATSKMFGNNPFLIFVIILEQFEAVELERPYVKLEAQVLRISALTAIRSSAVLPYDLFSTARMECYRVACPVDPGSDTKR